LTTVNGLVGLDKATKCTWQFIASASTNAPVFEISASPTYNYLLQVVEWLDKATLGTDAAFNGLAWGNTDGPLGVAPWYLGGNDGNTYKSDNANSLSKGVAGAVFFNPIILKSTDLTGG